MARIKRGRKCARCGEYKPLTDYDMRDSRRYYADCRECKPLADAVKKQAYFELKEKARQEKHFLEEAREQLSGEIPQQVEKLTALVMECLTLLKGPVCMVCGGREKVSYNGNKRPPRRCKRCWG